VSLGQIKRNGQGGRAMAIAGIVCGWLALAVGLVFIVAIAFFISQADSSSYYN
jgi:hypothetical protein